MYIFIKCSKAEELAKSGEREQRNSVTKMVRKNGLLLLEVYCGQSRLEAEVAEVKIRQVVIGKTSLVKIDP